MYRPPGRNRRRRPWARALPDHVLRASRVAARRRSLIVVAIVRSWGAPTACRRFAGTLPAFFTTDRPDQKYFPHRAEKACPAGSRCNAHRVKSNLLSTAASNETMLFRKHISSAPDPRYANRSSYRGYLPSRNNNSVSHKPAPGSHAKDLVAGQDNLPRDPY